MRAYYGGAVDYFMVTTVKIGPSSKQTFIQVPQKANHRTVPS